MRKGRGSTLVEARLRGEVADLQKRMHPYNRVVKAYDSDLWKAVCERLEKTAKNIADERAASYEKMSEVELKVSLAKEITLREVMGMPFLDREIQLKMADRLAATREKLRNYQKNKRG